MISTKYRSDQSEDMDDFNFSGPVLTKTLNQIANINKWLGGNAVTINGLKKLLKECPKDKKIKIIDLGCGNGDMLRVIANFGKKHGYEFELLGVDANQHTLDYAVELSKEYPRISYLMQDVLADDFQGIPCNIVLGTLFMHHFRTPEIVTLVTKMLTKANVGVIINDLHRSKLAYFLYKLVTFPVKNEMVKKDGLISILRGFKRDDLNEMASAMTAKSTIVWKWAFRYQWIIRK